MLVLYQTELHPETSCTSVAVGGRINKWSCARIARGCAGRRSVECFRGFAAGPGFPAAVDPPVLAGVGADDVFEGARVALGDVAERVVLEFPILRVYHV